LHGSSLAPAATCAMHVATGEEDSCRVSKPQSDGVEMGSRGTCSHGVLKLPDTMHELTAAGVTGVLDLRTTGVPVASGGSLAGQEVDTFRAGVDTACECPPVFGVFGIFVLFVFLMHAAFCHSC
jgi:hypothetical protein